MGCRNVLKAAGVAINKWFSPRESRAATREERNGGCSAAGSSREMLPRGSSDPGWMYPPWEQLPRGLSCQKLQQLLRARQSRS